MPVIPDKVIHVSITFPLTRPIVVKMATTKENICLKDLLLCIRWLYEEIYEEEENTATPQSYKLKRVCDNCHRQDILDHAEKLRDQEGECCICNVSYKEKGGALKVSCGHLYHEDCIATWCKRSTTCPICRENIMVCEKCSGKGHIEFDLVTTVIPLDFREPGMVRNLTNGRYGIFAFDFEDLYIAGMRYNRMEKCLYLSIAG